MRKLQEIISVYHEDKKKLWQNALKAFTPFSAKYRINSGNDSLMTTN